jgi:hypothetical protein
VPSRDILFTQPILTKPGSTRIALTVQVSELSSFLRGLDGQPVSVEHIYDY